MARQLPIRTYKEFEERESFKPIAGKLVEEFRKEFFAAVDPHFIGFHLRMFLDTSSPSVDYRSTLDELERITQRNLEEGKHPLNHVLDSLLYGDHVEHVLITIHFTSGSVHNFGRAETLRVPDGWSAHVATIQFTRNQNDIEEIDEFASITEIHKFCNRLNIAINESNCKSILHAMKLMLGLSKAGHNARIFIARPVKATGLVLGLTVFYEDDADCDDEKALAIIEKLSAYSDKLNQFTSIEELPPCLQGFAMPRILGPLAQIETGLRFGHERHTSGDPEDVVVDEVYRHIEPASDVQRVRKSFFRHSIRALLDVACSFADEQLEGRKLTYGLILGNPGLFDFMDGRKNVVPITMRLDQTTPAEFLRLRDLTENVHLLSDHSKRALIVPYMDDYQLLSSDPLPFFVMNLDKYEEYILPWSDGRVLLRDYRPYAYLTYRFKWAIAVVVGPGSQMRVFVGGRIIAFKDGKGWRVHGTTDAIFQDCPNVDRFKLRKFLEVACLLSPVYNPNSHGGLMLYNTSKIPETGSTFEGLNSNELCGLPGQKWLKDTQLFRGKYSAEFMALHPDDIESVEKLVQVAMLDGAIVCYGEDFTVQHFGVRVNVHSPDGNAGGTKRKTAAGFVREFGTPGSTTVALAVSSDGPVYVFRSPCEKDDKPFVCFERVSASEG